MIKLAVLSDIHGNLVALEAALADLESAGEVDMTWVLGDLSALGPRPAECLRRIRELREAQGKEKFKIIGGNTERYLVTGERFRTPPAKEEETFNQLAQSRSTIDTILNWNLTQISWDDYQYMAKILHRETSLYVEGYGNVIGYHAIPGDDEFMLRPDTPDEEATDALLDREGRLGIGGHTHIQMDRNIGRWRVVNVGSVGLSIDMPGKAQWGLFTFTDGDVSVDLRAVPYDVDAAIADMNAVNFPRIERMAVRLRPKT